MNGAARSSRDGLQLIIGSAAELRSHARGWATAVLSTSAPTLVRADRTCVLRFRDTTDAQHPDAFSEDHADVFVRFASTITDRRDERVVVACRAGVSRSPALAYGLLVAVGRSPARALRDVLRARPQARPNPLVVERLDEALGLCGAMTDELDRWARTHLWWAPRSTTARRQTAAFSRMWTPHADPRPITWARPTVAPSI